MTQQPIEASNHSFEISEINKCSHIITVLLHDYFHRGVFKQHVGEKQWNRFESRLDKNVDDTLYLLDTYNVKATFFTLGWIGDKNPEIIKRIANEGHEISNAGYWARSVTEMPYTQLIEDLNRSRRALEAAGSNRIIGFRSAYKWITKRDLPILSLLAEQGYRYDASYRPSLIKYKDSKNHRFMFSHQCPSGEIVEFPTSTVSFLGLNIPIAGGSYLRHFPHRLTFAAFKRWLKSTSAPFVLYFHPWELDSAQPVISAIDKMDHFRQYRNLGKLMQILPYYLHEAPFTSISQYLGLCLEYPLHDKARIEPRIDRPPISLCLSLDKAHKAFVAADDPKQELKPVSVAVPCYNESSSLPYLDKALSELVAEGSDRYDFYFVFVDDCSTDDTNEILQALFGENKKCRIVKHERNQGVAAALKTGILFAPTEIVCTIDADCSYDPLELLKMIPLMDSDADMVTASPYHVNGSVLGVPSWRLFLSKSLSRIYHRLLHHKLATYTSCFRVCRKTSIAAIELTFDDFRGVVEMLARLDLEGGRIVEFPTTLHSRIFGQSKMKVLNTIAGQLKLIGNILVRKMLR